MTTQNNNEQDFLKQLQALWSVENQLTASMPMMIDKATNLGLKKNLAMHLAETDQHKVAIEAICKTLGYDHQGEENSELKSILEEGQAAMNAASGGDMLDAAIIASAINVEHYEIQQYEAIGNVAEALGYSGFASRLRLTLEEERQADAKLNFLDKFYIQQSSILGATKLSLR